MEVFHDKIPHLTSGELKNNIGNVSGVSCCAQRVYQVGFLVKQKLKKEVIALVTYNNTTFPS